MARLLKTSFLQVLDFKIKDKKKFRFIINIAIFLSFFAVTSSIITIFYENNINKIRNEILSRQRAIYLAEVTRTQLPFNIMSITQNLDNLKKRESLMSINYLSGISVFSVRHMHYFPFIELRHYSTENFERVEEIFKITNMLISTSIESEKLTKEQLANKYLYLFIQYEELLKKNEEFKKITNEVDEDYNKSEDKIFQDEYYFKFANFHIIAKKNILLLNNFFTDCLGILNRELKNEEKEMLNLTKKISKISNNASNTILIAFFIQLIIFLLIQYMEISNTREQNAKR